MSDKKTAPTSGNTTPASSTASAMDHVGLSSENGESVSDFPDFDVLDTDAVTARYIEPANLIADGNIWLLSKEQASAILETLVIGLVERRDCAHLGLSKLTASSVVSVLNAAWDKLACVRDEVAKGRTGRSWRGERLLDAFTIARIVVALERDVDGDPTLALLDGIIRWFNREERRWVVAECGGKTIMGPICALVRQVAPGASNKLVGEAVDCVRELLSENPLTNRRTDDLIDAGELSVDECLVNGGAKVLHWWRGDGTDGGPTTDNPGGCGTLRDADIHSLGMHAVLGLWLVSDEDGAVVTNIPEPVRTYYKVEDGKQVAHEFHAGEFLTSLFDEANCEQGVRALQQALVYACFPLRDFQRVPLLFSEANVGKSTFLTGVRTAFGGKNAVASAPPESWGKDSVYLSMTSKDANIVEELSTDAYMKGAALRRFRVGTTGGTEEVDRKYQDSVNARLSCAQLYGANRLPKSADNTNGYFRRFFPINCHGSKQGKRISALKRDWMTETGPESFVTYFFTKALERFGNVSEFDMTNEVVAESMDAMHEEIDVVEATFVEGEFFFEEMGAVPTQLFGQYQTALARANNASYPSLRGRAFKDSLGPACERRGLHLVEFAGPEHTDRWYVPNPTVVGAILRECRPETTVTLQGKVTRYGNRDLSRWGDGHEPSTIRSVIMTDEVYTTWMQAGKCYRDQAAEKERARAEEEKRAAEAAAKRDAEAAEAAKARAAVPAEPKRRTIPDPYDTDEYYAWFCDSVEIANEEFNGYKLSADDCLSTDPLTRDEWRKRFCPVVLGNDAVIKRIETSPYYTPFRCRKAVDCDAAYEHYCEHAQQCLDRDGSYAIGGSVDNLDSGGDDVIVLRRVLDRDAWRIFGMVVERVRRVRASDGSTVWLFGPAQPESFGDPVLDTGGEAFERYRSAARKVLDEAGGYAVVVGDSGEPVVLREVVNKALWMSLNSPSAREGDADVDGRAWPLLKPEMTPEDLGYMRHRTGGGDRRSGAGDLKVAGDDETAFASFLAAAQTALDEAGGYVVYDGGPEGAALCREVIDRDEWAAYGCPTKRADERVTLGDGTTWPLIE